MVDQLLRVKMKAVLGSFDLAVDLSAPLGLIVLFGPSGSGKSTFLDCLAGLRAPDEGLISAGSETFFDSQAGVNLPPQKRKLGYVFQRPALFPHLSISANIGFGIEDWPAERRTSRIEQLLELLHLRQSADRFPASLSGGEAQRAALARAIAPEPRLLLLDEPFSALDMKLREELGHELRSLQRDLTLPMVLVTHSRQEAIALADVLVCINAGKIEKVGSPSQILIYDGQKAVGEGTQFSW